MNETSVTTMETEINAIWKSHHDKLLSFIRKNVHQPDVAEDLLHDVFLKIRDNIGQLKDMEKIQPWMYRIARNVIIDHFRLQQKTRSNEDNLPDEEGETEGNRMGEAENWIGSYVQALPENYRKAVQMFELEKKSLAEIADSLHISYTNARSRVQRGRNALKKNLMDCCTFHVDVYGNIIDYERNKKK